MNKKTKLKPKVSLAVPLVSLQVHIAFSMYVPSSISPTDGECFLEFLIKLYQVIIIIKIHNAPSKSPTDGEFVIVDEK